MALERVDRDPKRDGGFRFRVGEARACLPERSSSPARATGDPSGPLLVREVPTLFVREVLTSLKTEWGRSGPPSTLENGAEALASR